MLKRLDHRVTVAIWSTCTLDESLSVGPALSVRVSRPTLSMRASSNPALSMRVLSTGPPHHPDLSPRTATVLCVLHPFHRFRRFRPTCSPLSSRPVGIVSPLFEFYSAGMSCNFSEILSFVIPSVRRAHRRRTGLVANQLRCNKV